MVRRNVILASCRLVVACVSALVAVLTAEKNSPETSAGQIEKLQDRVTEVEARVKAVEQKPPHVALPPNVAHPHEGPVVPDWFLPSRQKRYAIFDAWRQLTTKEAALYLGHDWDLCAGVLQDEQGTPIGNCVLSISYDRGTRPCFAGLMTDENGRFIIYSPYGGIPLKTDRVRFAAAPGYPFSHMGMQFAQSEKAWAKCSVRVVPVSDDRCFCVLTCPRQNKYSAARFTKFMEQQVTEWRGRRVAPYRAQPDPREGPAGRGIRNEYHVRVVSPAGAPIPDALLMFTAYDGFVGNNQIVRSDPTGTCMLIEELLLGQEPKYYAQVRKWLTVDIPGYAVGPVPFTFKTNEVNIIKAREGARIRGHVVDWNGNPFRQRLGVQYQNRNSVTFELDVYPGPDGGFVIERIMPGEPFRLCLHRGSHQTTPSPEVWSETFTLEPGQTREGVVMKVPQAAALRGVVVDEEDRPVTGIWRLAFENRDRGWGHGDPVDGKFGTYGVAPGPLRIEVGAKGFEPYVSAPISLEPGELRFIRVVMKLQKPKHSEKGSVLRF
jgi:hypothetical protein